MELSQAIEGLKAGQTAAATAIQEILVARGKDDKAWAAASSQNLIEAWQKYLADWPNGHHVAKARSAISFRERNHRLIPTSIWRVMERNGETPSLVSSPNLVKDNYNDGSVPYGTLSIFYDYWSNSDGYKYTLNLTDADQTKIWTSKIRIDNEIRIFAWADQSTIIASDIGQTVISINLRRVVELDVGINSASLSSDSKIAIGKTEYGIVFAWDLTGLN